VLVQNTGAVLSIAFVMALITAAVPRTVLFKVFGGLGQRITTHQLTPFIDNMHTALWCLTFVSVLGAVVSFARPKHIVTEAVGESGLPPVEDGIAVVAKEPGREAALA